MKLDAIGEMNRRYDEQYQKNTAADKAQVLACNSDWLNSTGGTVAMTTTGALTSSYYPYTTYGYYPVYQVSPARPIKLKLSEVERLRKAARADKALKSILEKFTNQIEITVDFD